MNTSGSSPHIANRKKTTKILGSDWPMGLGQYNSLGEYCGPHTAASVIIILSLFCIRNMTLYLHGIVRVIIVYIYR